MDSCPSQVASGKLQVVCRSLDSGLATHAATAAATAAQSKAEAQLKMVWATLAASFDNCQLPNRGNVQPAAAAAFLSLTRTLCYLSLSLSLSVWVPVTHLLLL